MKDAREAVDGCRDVDVAGVERGEAEADDVALTDVGNDGRRLMSLYRVHTDDD